MSRNWTENQQKAIDARGKNILVSAAAGSGKTAVLVERVISMITDKALGVSLDSLLIVTFTNAAAAEMKSRISKSLNRLISENPQEEYYRKQLSLLSLADICTIDSFCIRLVREYFYELSVSQDFTILDESEAQLMQDKVISEILDNDFTESKEEFKILLDAFTTPTSDRELTAIVKRILQFIYAHPFPYKWIDDSLKLYSPDIAFEDTVWYSYVRGECLYLISCAEKLAQENIELINYDPVENEKLLDIFRSDLNELGHIREKLENNWCDLVNKGAPKLLSLSKTTYLGEELSDKLKSNRELYKGIITKDIQKLIISTPEDYYEDCKSTLKILEKLNELVRLVDERLMEEKKEKNAYTFSDIEHFAIKLLFSIDDNGEISSTSLADSLRDKYSEILVDEYQDTNKAQNLLFTYLSKGNNLFTVGDIKQSIYRFRLAMPDIFNNKRKSYPRYSAESKSKDGLIILDRNFRSRKGVCDYVNFVFSNLMSEQVGDIDYNEDEYLNAHNDFESTEVPCARIDIVENNSGKDADEREALYIAKLIKDKINGGELIKDESGYRPINYGDIAILMRSLKGRADTYTKVLTEQGIPVVCDSSTNLFENNEIKILLSLLRVISNPTNNVALLAVMLSPFYGFTPDELAEIRIENPYKDFYRSVFSSENEKVLSFINDLNELRRVSVTMTVSSFIRYVTAQKGLLSFINAMGNSEQRYQNILTLISLASSFDAGVNVGLTAFIRYIDSISKLDKTVESASVNTSSAQSVTLMTVHHSKGLEFPVCILAGASKLYNKSDLSDKLLLNNTLGFTVKAYNEEKMYQYKTLPYTVISNNNEYELMSENLRVLYVAMTRAKEQFITVLSTDSAEKKLTSLSKYISGSGIMPYSVMKMRSDADMILLTALLYKKNSDNQEFDLTVNIISPDEETDVNTVKQSAPYNADIVSEIGNRIAYRYERSDLQYLSGKLTASSLDDGEVGFEYLTSSKPSFMNKSGLTPAQRGSAMHTFMQYADYKNAENDLEKEIIRLCNLKYFDSQQAESLDRIKLKKFFESELYNRIKNADSVYREVKVSKFFRANEIYDTEFNDEVLIQGIADLVFTENGKLILVDYKTDRVKDEDELLSRYKRQIAFYKSAVSDLYGLPVSESMLYSFSLNKCCYYN